MELYKPATIACMVFVFMVGLLASVSKATSMDQHLQTLQMDRDRELDENSWKWLLRSQLQKEFMDLDTADQTLSNQIENLNTQRDQIRAQKRGHTQCFLNLVSCYRRRK